MSHKQEHGRNTESHLTVLKYGEFVFGTAKHRAAWKTTFAKFGLSF